MVNYMKAIKKPFTDFRKLSIAALMFLVPIVNILTGFIGNGYFLHIARNPGSKLPEWSDWGRLFIIGLVAFLISIVYALPIIAIAVLTIVSGITVVGLLAVPPLLALLVIVLLLTLYIIPMVLVHYAQDFSAGSAFRLNSIFRKSITLKYLGVWILMVLYSLVVNSFAGLLAGVSDYDLVAWIVGSYSAAIIGITMFDTYGQVYDELSSKSAGKPAKKPARKK